MASPSSRHDPHRPHELPLQAPPRKKKPVASEVPEIVTATSKKRLKLPRADKRARAHGATGLAVVVVRDDGRRR